jgi:hypothetical protein
MVKEFLRHFAFVVSAVMVILVRVSAGWIGASIPLNNQQFNPPLVSLLRNMSTDSVFVGIRDNKPMKTADKILSHPHMSAMTFDRIGTLTITFRAHRQRA